jgi:phage shock protein E
LLFNIKAKTANMSLRPAKFALVLLVGYGVRQWLARPAELPQAQAAVAQGAWVVDVRTPAEFAQGHYPGAVNVPMGQVASEAPRLKAAGKTLVVCCASGGRSRRAKELLQAQGLAVPDAGAWTNLQP